MKKKPHETTLREFLKSGTFVFTVLVIADMLIDCLCDKISLAIYFMDTSNQMLCMTCVIFLIAWLTAIIVEQLKKIIKKLKK